MSEKTNRRRLLARGLAVTTAAAMPLGVKAADTKPAKKVFFRGGRRPESTPLFSAAVSYGNLVFVSGTGGGAAKGDIKVQTKYVLDEIQKTLESAGSSMEKVLKVNVFLADIKDYREMNEVYLGSFGSEPPVRTTVAAGALPGGGSLVEIECIAYA